MESYQRFKECPNRHFSVYPGKSNVRRGNEIQIISKGNLTLKFMQAVKSSGKHFLGSRTEPRDIRMELVGPEKKERVGTMDGILQ